MSIDARVAEVHLKPDGNGKLILIDRPPKRAGETPGIAGQPELSFEKSPIGVLGLVNKDIWGGDSSIMLGDVKIAKRTGWTTIEFLTESLQ